MMLDTEDETGECILCKKRSRFTREEIDAAESRRDGLSERYLGPIQQAFNDNDFETVTSLCEEIGREGVSSWYIWTVAGVCDARQGKGDQAMDAFGLATEFLDEESFDEFYDMVMDAVLDTFVADCNEERDFSIPLSDLMNLSSTIEERFYEIMDIGFPQDLFIRIGMLDTRRMRLHTSRPSMPGSMMSRRIREGAAASNRASASSPERASR